MGGPDQAERCVDGLTGANQAARAGPERDKWQPTSPGRDQLDVSVGSKAEKLGMSTICPGCLRKRIFQCLRVYEYTPWLSIFIRQDT